MTKKDEETIGYCCICIIVMIVIGLFITYWYIALPAVLIILTGCIIVEILKNTSRHTNEEIKRKNERFIAQTTKKYIPPEPEYPPNCVNCGMPIKTVDDLISINNCLHCKYCGTLREKTNQKQFSLTGNYYEWGERAHPDEWYETERPDYEKNLREYLTQESSKKRSRHISSQVKREVWQRDYGRCVECGSNINLEYDHIIPFSKGGSNTTRNIQLLCEKCNRKKHDKI